VYDTIHVLLVTKTAMHANAQDKTLRTTHWTPTVTVIRKSAKIWLIYETTKHTLLVLFKHTKKNNALQYRLFSWLHWTMTS